MTKKHPPKGSTLRLASETALSSSLYNVYHFLTQVAGLYAQAAENEKLAFRRQVFLQLSDQALSDLGEIYSLWDETLHDKEIVRDEKLASFVSRSCARTDHLIALLTIWAPALKWIKALQLCERRYGRILNAVAGHKVSASSRLKVLTDSGVKRQGLLGGLLAAIEKDAKAMHESFLAQRQVS